jgi:hypothetical protein
MRGRTITALFSREPDARRAADAVRALGYGDGRAMLAPWGELAGDLSPAPMREGSMREGDAGFVLVVSPEAEDEDKLVGVIDHYRPERLVREEEAGPPCMRAARPDAGSVRPESGRPSAADRLRAAAAALRRAHEGPPSAPVPAREAEKDPASDMRGDGRRRSLPETETGD